MELRPSIVWSELLTGRKLVTKAHQRNEYPNGFILKHTCLQSDWRSPCDHETRASLTLPYLNGLSESIHRVLVPLHTIQVTSYPFRTLRQELVAQKDPVPANWKEWCAGSCVPNAPTPTYIGQMVRSLDHCLQEHRQALKNRDLAASSLAEHVFSCNHRVALSKVMVIDTHSLARLVA